MAGISHGCLHLYCSAAGRELEEIATTCCASQRCRGDSGSAAQQKDPAMTQRRFWSLQLLVLLIAATAPAVVWAQGSAAPPSSLMGRIRSFLGVQPRSVSVGGTRSGAAQSVCLLSPGPIEPSRRGPAVRVLDPRPHPWVRRRHNGTSPQFGSARSKASARKQRSAYRGWL
jgi:hypothetical protein